MAIFRQDNETKMEGVLSGKMLDDLTEYLEVLRGKRPPTTMKMKSASKVMEFDTTELFKPSPNALLIRAFDAFNITNNLIKQYFVPALERARQHTRVWVNEDNIEELAEIVKTNIHLGFHSSADCIYVKFGDKKLDKAMANKLHVAQRDFVVGMGLIYLDAQDAGDDKKVSELEGRIEFLRESMVRPIGAFESFSTIEHIHAKTDGLYKEEGKQMLGFVLNPSDMTKGIHYVGADKDARKLAGQRQGAAHRRG